MTYDDPHDDPNNYFSTPPLVTVEQANPPERIPMDYTDPNAYPVDAPPPVPTGSQVGTATGTFVKSLFNILMPRSQQPQYVQPVQQPLPGWVIPVAIGAGVLVLMAVMRRRGGGKRRVAGYRRRSRR